MQNPDWQKIKEVFNQTLDLPQDKRETFLANLDTSIRNEVLELIKSSEQAENFINEPAAVDFNFGQELAVGTVIDNYRIIKSIGFGGMGAVYLAERTDLGQKVAVKLIKRGMDTREVLKRFNLERQILSRLNHPNIAGLLDAGSTEDGLPYFVMEYIEGETIIKFCDSHQFDINERLELFQKACSAISYAHANLIVHRDIKPSNIIVTADGTPKLLDFGIAKLLDNETENTATQARIFTPEYASPEQIKGLPITTATDVYSLGVVLYQLLSGVRPFTSENRNYGEIAKMVLTVEPVKPSSVVSGQWSVVRNTREIKDETESEFTKLKPLIPNPKTLIGDLDNIILKSLRKEPERRYQSVSDFSEDIKRHLQGLPVTATADTTRYRFTKFVQRHKRGVAISSIVGLLILAISGVAIWQAIVANRERAKAEARFNDVRKLANIVLFEYHDGIEKLAGSTPMREKMVKDSLEYLDKLSIDGETDPDLQSEIATAYQKVGDVQGNPFSANLGNQEGAQESFQKALSIRQMLFENDQTNIKKKTDLAISHERVGDILWGKGDSDGAKSHYQTALDFYVDISKTGKISDSGTLPRIYNRIGEIFEQQGDLGNALQAHQKSLEISQNLINEEPNDKGFQRRYAVSFAKIGDVYYQLDDFQKAAENYQKCYPLMNKLSLDDPSNLKNRRFTGLVLARLGLVKMEMGDFTDAIKHNEDAIAIISEISAADPNDKQTQYDLADTVANLGQNLGELKRFELSEETFKKAIAIYKANPNSDYSQYRLHFSSTYLDYANVLLKQKKTSFALANFRHGLKILDNEEIQGEAEEILAKIYEGIGDTLLFSPNPSSMPEAKMMYQKSHEIWRNKESKGTLTKKDSSKPAELMAKIERPFSTFKDGEK
jgi:eukaryotic-like serine/threonine-protein kinase